MLTKNAFLTKLEDRKYPVGGRLFCLLSGSIFFEALAMKSITVPLCLVRYFFLVPSYKFHSTAESAEWFLRPLELSVSKICVILQCMSSILDSVKVKKIHSKSRYTS